MNKWRRRLVVMLWACWFLDAPVLTLAERFAKVQVNDPFIELRTGPGRGFPIFYVAEQGEWVEVLVQKTGWYRVRLHNGKEGWVDRHQMARTLTDDHRRVDLRDADFEEYLDRTWEFGIGHGDFAGAAVIAASAGWHFTRNLSAELTLTQALGNFSEVDTATLSLVNEPFPTWRVSPFFGVGGGALRVQPRATLVQVVDRQDEVVFVTAGVRSYLTRRFLVRLDYRSFVVLTSRNDNEDEEEWKIGFSIFF